MRREDALRALAELEAAYGAGLEGWPLLVAGQRAVVVGYERGGAPSVRYKSDSGETGQLGPRDVLPALVAWQREHGQVREGKNVPEGVDKLAAMLLSVAQHLKPLAGVQEEEIAATVRAHELHDVLSPFVTMEGIVSYFNEELGMPISRSSIGRKGHKRTDASAYLSEAQEEDLARHVAEMAERGRILLESEVRQIAAELKYDRAGAPKASKEWYKGWLQRMEGKVSLQNVSTSDLPAECAANYNAAYIDWWYDTTKERLKGLGVVTEPAAGEKGELTWRFFTRVLVLGATKIISRKSSGPRSVCIPGDMIPLLPYMRVKEPPPRAEQMHATLLAGWNLGGQPTPPHWILKSESPDKATQDQMSEIISSSCTSRTLGAFGTGSMHAGGGLAWSADGDLTRENFLTSMLQVLEPAFPDMSDADPSKRVIIFMDGRSSHHYCDAVRALEQRGVYLHFWLPRTFAQSQALDLKFFGALKRKAQKYKEQKIQDPSDQFVQIRTSARAITAVTWPPDQLHNTMRHMGLTPFTRQAHLAERAAKTGGMRHEEMTLPLGGSGLLKYIQRAEGVLPKGTAGSPPATAAAADAAAAAAAAAAGKARAALREITLSNANPAASSSSSSHRVSTAGPSWSSPTKRPLTPDSASGSRGAKCPRPALPAASSLSMPEAKVELRRLLEQEKPPITRMRQVLRTIKNFLSKAGDPMWRDCVLNTKGDDFISQATGILVKLEALDALPEARGKLRRLLEQKKPQIKPTKEALGFIVVLLREAEDPIWQSFEPDLKKHGAEFLSKAAQILDRLDARA